MLGDHASGGVQEFPMHLIMLRDTKAFGWRVPLPTAGEVLLSVKDGDQYQYQLTSLRWVNLVSTSNTSFDGCFHCFWISGLLEFEYEPGYDHSRGTLSFQLFFLMISVFVVSDD